MSYLKIILMTVIQIFIFINYLPKIIKMLIEEKGEKISLLSFISSLIISISFIIYGIYSYDALIIITFSTQLALLIISEVITIKYSK